MPPQLYSTYSGSMTLLPFLAKALPNMRLPALAAFASVRIFFINSSQKNLSWNSELRQYGYEPLLVQEQPTQHAYQDQLMVDHAVLQEPVDPILDATAYPNSLVTKTDAILGGSGSFFINSPQNTTSWNSELMQYDCELPLAEQPEPVQVAAVNPPIFDAGCLLKGSSSGKKRVSCGSVDDETEEKRNSQKRESAARLKENNKVYVEEMEAKVLRLQEENKNLTKENAELDYLKTKVPSLEQQIERHRTAIKLLNGLDRRSKRFFSSGPPPSPKPELRRTKSAPT